MESDLVKVAYEHLKWIPGRMIGGSKTLYREKHPENEVYFNANIFTIDGKEWWGDIDLTIDKDDLQTIANKSNKTLFIISEHDGRFENEKLSYEEILKRAKVTIEPNNKN